MLHPDRLVDTNQSFAMRSMNEDHYDKTCLLLCIAIDVFGLLHLSTKLLYASTERCVKCTQRLV